MKKVILKIQYFFKKRKLSCKIFNFQQNKLDYFFHIYNNYRVVIFKQFPYSHIKGASDMKKVIPKKKSFASSQKKLETNFNIFFLLMSQKLFCHSL